MTKKAKLLIDQPKSCDDCIISYFENTNGEPYCYDFGIEFDFSKRPADCPLIEIESEETCKWTKRTNSYYLGYDTQCGCRFFPIYVKNTFCPHCGREIEIETEQNNETQNAKL